MTRQVRAFLTVVALILVAAVSSYLTSISADLAADPRPLPTLVDGLSPTATTARQEFAQRIRERFPLGSADRVLMLDLWAQGFEHPGGSDGRHWASLERRGAPCNRAWTVSWSTDDGGHLTAVDGTYIPSCS